MCRWGIQFLWNVWGRVLMLSNRVMMTKLKSDDPNIIKFSPLVATDWASGEYWNSNPSIPVPASNNQFLRYIPPLMVPTGVTKIKADWVDRVGVNTFVTFIDATGVKVGVFVLPLNTETLIPVGSTLRMLLHLQESSYANLNGKLTLRFIFS